MRKPSKLTRANLLTETKVYRKGDTEKRWYTEADFVEGSANKSGAELYLHLKSAGPGHSNIRVAISPADYPQLLALMAEADQNAAVEAMVEELRYQVCQTAADPLRPKRNSN